MSLSTRPDTPVSDETGSATRPAASAKPIRIGILGASGYTGAELLRLIALHPVFELAVACAHTDAGQKIGDLFPHLIPFRSVLLRAFEEAEEQLLECDVLFSALPHGASASVLSQLLQKATSRNKQLKVIDLSSDFRLKTAEDYRTWYHLDHPEPEALKSWQYGLTEFYREEIAASSNVANPGCYATAILLGLLPFVRQNLLHSPIVIDACSGVSGAGKKPTSSLHFSQIDEGMCAYKIGSHQHTAEIELTLAALATTPDPASKLYLAEPLKISMTAHLVPMARGIHATCSAQLTTALSSTEANALLQSIYEESPFIIVSEKPPHTKSVRGSNAALLHATVDQRTDRLIVVSVIDNLVKGASGQAIQNANLMCGLPETLGLPLCGVYP